jgi:hypothetical protein
LEDKRNTTIDFIGIGAMKAGTTWLYENLNSLDKFSFPIFKEIHYFDRSKYYISSTKLEETYFLKRLLNIVFFKKILKIIYKTIKLKSFRKEGFQKLSFHFSNYNDRWYSGLFKNFKNYSGEITPAYMFLEKKDIIRMHKFNENLKLILILRNPIERAWSHYKFKFRKGYELNLKSIDSIIKFMDSDEQTLRGDYIRSINNYLEVFDKSQLLICFYDAIIENPKLLIKEIIDHITCNNEIISIDNLDLSRVINPTKKLDMPDIVLDHLKKKYKNDIKELSDLFGGYFNKWYENSYQIKSQNKNRLLKPSFIISQVN